MRIVIPTVALLLALPALALGSPLRCADPCIVETNYAGYVPPAVEVESAGSVVWRSTGGGHIQADTGTQLECFVTFVDGGADSDPARFTIQNGSLWANTSALGDQECKNAVKVNAETFVLPYECTIHPNMRGAIVVQAE